MDLEIDTQSSGDVALRMHEIPEGARIQVNGFLAQRSLQSSRIVLHVNDIVNLTIPN